MQRPCISCGVLIASGSRCTDCQRPLNNNYQRGREGRTSSDWKWRKLSQAQRKRVPFCELCGTKTDLTAGHIISLQEDPSLAHEPLNIRTECRPCGSRRGTTCTDTERQQVLDTIAARKARTQRYYASQLKPTG